MVSVGSRTSAKVMKSRGMERPETFTNRRRQLLHILATSEHSAQKIALCASLRIPTKPARHSNMKPATDSDLKPAGVPI